MSRKLLGNKNAFRRDISVNYSRLSDPRSFAKDAHKFILVHGSVKNIICIGRNELVLLSLN